MYDILCVFIILGSCLLLSSSTGYQICKHGFQISRHVPACRHIILGPGCAWDRSATMFRTKNSRLRRSTCPLW